MKKLIMNSLVLCSMMFFVAGSAFAVKPTAEGYPPVNPNGFPAGEHFNLNIHGKKADFNCPDPFDGFCGGVDHTGDFGTCEDTDGDGVGDTWKYSNSLFIPEGTVDNPVDGITILMETGKSGGRGKKNEDLVLQNSLVVKDPCSFGANDPAVYQLPPAKNGYWVFWRALAKPGHPGDPETDPYLTISDFGVNFFEDGDGNKLYYAGTVGPSSVSSTTNGTTTITRTKGQSRAVNITSLFTFTGDICYIEPTDCPGYVDEANPGDCFTTFLCCADLDSDGAYDVCELREDSEFDDNEVVDEFDPCIDRDLDNDMIVDDLEEKIGTCKTYTDEPIFNLADFMQFFMNVDNNGLKLLQLRFYPIPDSV
jgi:hypothetical protein